MWTYIKNSYEFLTFFDNFDTFVTYHNVLLEIYLIHKHRIVPATQTFFPCFIKFQVFHVIKKRPQHKCFPVNIAKFFRKPILREHLHTAASFCFHRLAKPTTFTPVVMNEPLFAQNVLGLTSLLCIVFIANVFPWLHFVRFQSTKVSWFCLRLGVIRWSVWIIMSHVVEAAFYIR